MSPSAQDDLLRATEGIMYIWEENVHDFDVNVNRLAPTFFASSRFRPNFPIGLFTFLVTERYVCAHGNFQNKTHIRGYTPFTWR